MSFIIYFFPIQKLEIVHRISGKLTNSLNYLNYEALYNFKNRAFNPTITSKLKAFSQLNRSTKRNSSNENVSDEYMATQQHTKIK